MNDSQNNIQAVSRPMGPPVNLKILVPAIASGAIIGKGGETIADVQKQTGTRIKMSKANDFYPGTTERVGLIQGPAESVLIVMDFIAEKIIEKPDPAAKPAIDFDNKIPAEREKQVKVIIPNSTAGMIIGKGGSFIKQLKDESGAFIQISQKSKDATLSERVVTIIGEKNANKKALEMILSKIQEDPQSASCLNISYGDVQGLVANPNPTGSPFATVAQSSERSVKGAVVLPNTPFSLNLGNGRALDLRFNSVPGWPTADPNLMTQYLQQMTSTLRSLGFTENTIEEIIRSIGCLATHGILTLTNPPDSARDEASVEQAWSDNNPGLNLNRAISPSALSSSNNSSAAFNNTNTYGLVTNQNEDLVELEIQENAVGAVIGPAGRSIIELQQFSGARIQVSKKGAFSPGTRNRIVSISGPQQSVATAKYLIEKKIQEEDGKRLQSY